MCKTKVIDNAIGYHAKSTTLSILKEEQSDVERVWKIGQKKKKIGDHKTDPIPVGYCFSLCYHIPIYPDVELYYELLFFFFFFTFASKRFSIVLFFF